MTEKTQTKPILYLHIGHPKAGSTTLQNFLFVNWPYLHQKGFALPTSNLQIADPDHAAGNILQTLERLVETQDITPIQTWINRCLDQKRPATKLILSSENLFLPHWPKLFQTLHGLIDVHLIYYIRRQDQLFLSAWQQWGLKHGKSLTDLIQHRIENQQPHYQSIINGWLDTGLIANQHIRFINSAFLKDGNLLADFCDFTNINYQQCTPIENQNTAIDGRLLMFMSRHPEVFSSPHDNQIFSLLNDTSKKPTVRVKLTRTEYNMIKTAFEPANQEILKTYHPSYAGIAVIDDSTADLNNDAQTISIDEQLAYVQERIAAAGNPSHPSLQLLQTILNSYSECSV
jgi:hypothetical protein